MVEREIDGWEERDSGGESGGERERTMQVQKLFVDVLIVRRDIPRAEGVVVCI